MLMRLNSKCAHQARPPVGARTQPRRAPSINPWGYSGLSCKAASITARPSAPIASSS